MATAFIKSLSLRLHGKTPVVDVGFAASSQLDDATVTQKYNH